MSRDPICDRWGCDAISLRVVPAVWIFLKTVLRIGYLIELPLTIGGRLRPVQIIGYDGVREPVVTLVRGLCEALQHRQKCQE